MSGEGVAPPRHRPSDPKSLRALFEFAADRGQAAVDLLRLPKLNVNACGDFTLLAREDWHRVRGYPEFVAHSMNIDTLFMHQVHANGLRFVDLEPPAVAYHMEHALGSGWTPEGQKEHFSRPAVKGMHHIAGAELRDMKRSMLARAREPHPVVFNEGDWGLAQGDVVEERLAGN